MISRPSFERLALASLEGNDTMKTKLATLALTAAVLLARAPLAHGEPDLGALGEAPATSHWNDLFLDWEEPNPDAAHESSWSGPRAKKWAWSVEVFGRMDHGQRVYTQTTRFKNASGWDLWNDPRDTQSDTHVPPALADRLDAEYAAARSAGALDKGTIAPPAGDHPNATSFTITWWGSEKGSKMTRVSGLLEVGADGSVTPLLDAAHESLRPLLADLIAQARLVHAQDAHLPEAHYGEAQDTVAQDVEVKGKVVVDPATGSVSVQDGKTLRKVTNEPFASILRTWAGQKVDLEACVAADGSVRVLGDPEAVKGDAKFLDAPGGQPVPAISRGLKSDKYYSFTITGEKDGWLEVEVEDQAGLATPRRAYVAPSSVVVGGGQKVSDVLAGTGVAAAGSAAGASNSGPRSGIVQGLGQVQGK